MPEWKDYFGGQDVGRFDGIFWIPWKKVISRTLKIRTMQLWNARLPCKSFSVVWKSQLCRSMYKNWFSVIKQWQKIRIMNTIMLHLYDCNLFSSFKIAMQKYNVWSRRTFINSPSAKFEFRCIAITWRQMQI